MWLLLWQFYRLVMPAMQGYTSATWEEKITQKKVNIEQIVLAEQTL